MKWQPHPYQKEALSKMLKSPSHALWLDPGEGKTSTTLAALSSLLKRKEIKGALILATANIVQFNVWPREIQKWDDFKHLSYVTLHGKDKNDLVRKKANLYIMNYEGLPWLLDHLPHLLKNVDTIVFDESSKIKGFKTQRFKIIKLIIDQFKRRYELTGTPSSNSAMDLFSQIYALDDGQRLGRFITHYRNQFFMPTGYKGYNYVIQEGGWKRIESKIKDIVYRTPEDYLKIPKEKYNDVVIELPSDLSVKYKKLEDDFILRLNDKTIVAGNASSNSIKLRQFANGVLYDDNKAPVAVHDYKIQAAIDIVEELQGSPILIGYEFKSDLLMLRNAFPDAPYIGTTLDNQSPSQKDKVKIEHQWNAGKLPVLLGQISSVAHGLNLQESGHNLMLFSQVFNLEDIIQFIRRVRRQGQKKRVIVHRLIVKDSMDEDVIAATRLKNHNQQSILDAMRQRRK